MPKIHELNSKALTSPAYIPADDGSDTYKVDLSVLLQAIQSQIGDLDELTTTEKSDLVGAINEAAQSGGSGSSVLIVHFTAEEDEPIESDKTFAEISAAIDAGKLVVMEFGGLTYQLYGYEANSYVSFVNMTFVYQSTRVSEVIYTIDSTDEITSSYTMTDNVPTQAAVSNGSIVFKNSNSATLFSVALPIYTGGVS